jgi:hypothetical protein
VERRQPRERFEALRDGIVDERRLSELRSAVDDAVGDGGDVGWNRREGVDRLRRAVGRDQRQLQARRAGVDDENAVGAQ